MNLHPFLFISLTLFFSISNLYAEENSSEIPKVEYEKPALHEVVTNIPDTLVDSFKQSFNLKTSTLITWGAVISSSVLLYIYDEQIYAEAQRMGRRLGLGNDDHTKSYVSIMGTNILQGPSDLGSGLYYIGNGWTQFSIATAFYVTGQVNSDNRAMQTGTQIMTGLLSGSIPTQIIKRATGREDAYRASQYRGKWRPFDKNYDKDLSAHDAVPSGHLMAATTTFTVIDTNYPEYRHIIRPVGFGLLGLLSFQMMNLGVHWASDFPLALAIGYVSGKAASKNGIIHSSKKDKKVTQVNKPKWSFAPIFYSYLDGHHVYGVNSGVSF